MTTETTFAPMSFSWLLFSVCNSFVSYNCRPEGFYSVRIMFTSRRRWIYLHVSVDRAFSWDLHQLCLCCKAEIVTCNINSVKVQHQRNMKTGLLKQGEKRIIICRSSWKYHHIWVTSFSGVQACSKIMWNMRFHSFNHDLNPITLIPKLDLDNVKRCVLKMKFLASAVQTHGDLTEIITYPPTQRVITKAYHWDFQFRYEIS